MTSDEFKAQAIFFAALDAFRADVKRAQYLTDNNTISGQLQDVMDSLSDNAPSLNSWNDHLLYDEPYVGGDGYDRARDEDERARNG